MNSQEIIDLIRQRKEIGAEELLKHFGPLIRYIIAPILPDKQDQEECVSEIAMRVWEKIDLFDETGGSWNAWLTALSRNTALNKARQNKRQSRNQSVEEVSTEIPSKAPTPEEHVLQKERQKVLQNALGKLSSEERLLFYRKYYYLQSTAQIASELGLTERGVEGRLYRLKNKLRKMLGGD